MIQDQVRERGLPLSVLEKEEEKKRTNINRMEKKSTEINEVTSTKIHVITSW